MKAQVTRRSFVTAAGLSLGAAASAAAGSSSEPGSLKIIGISTSPRPGKTTAQGLRVCLEAAREVHPRISVELIELAGKRIDGSVAAGVKPEPGSRDDFPALVPILSDPSVVGIIVGTPVYFGNMSSLCKAFLDRCIVFRKKSFALRNKVGGVLAVGGARNGGQELAIRSIQTALLCQEMIVVGDGRPTAHFGATLWNRGDSIQHDTFGLATARNLGRRVAEVALLIHGK